MPDTLVGEDCGLVGLLVVGPSVVVTASVVEAVDVEGKVDVKFDAAVV